jgi:regulator of protease activity HflC (stomatin/prohibitin superfamily)
MVSALGVLGLLGCTASTESTEVGVRTAYLTVLGPRGVVKEIYPQGGTYFFLRAISAWDVFDVGLQNLRMVREETEGDRLGDDSVRFKTTDGNDISVNVTISWTVLPERAPYLVQFVGRSTEEVGDKLVRTVARAVVRDALNELTSEQFYQAEKRFQLSEVARQRLASVLEGEGLHVEQVLLGEHQFNATYEQTIRDKKIAEQEASRLSSETEAAAEEMKRDLERAKGEVQQAIEVALGEAQKRKLEADASFFEKERQATAILAEKRARAEGLAARARALGGSGGRNLVKLAVADALQGKRIVFLPASGGMDLRTTDMNDLLEVYGLRAVAKE